MESKFSHKDKVKKKPKMKLVKNKLRESLEKTEYSPTTKKVLEEMVYHLERVAELQVMMGMKIGSDQLISQRMLRMTKEELDSLEKKLLEKKTKPSPTE